MPKRGHDHEVISLRYAEDGTPIIRESVAMKIIRNRSGFWYRRGVTTHWTKEPDQATAFPTLEAAEREAFAIGLELDEYVVDETHKKAKTQ